MPDIPVALPAGARLEFAIAQPIEGKEDQLFGQYFPQVGPIVGSHGGRSVGRFQVQAQPDDTPPVSFGALFLWPSRAAYDTLHADVAFKELVGLRDTALARLWSGNFFDTGDGVTVTLTSDTTYAVVFADAPVTGALLSVPFADDSASDRFAGSVLSILPAGDAPEGARRYDIRLAPPA